MGKKDKSTGAFERSRAHQKGDDSLTGIEGLSPVATAELSENHHIEYIDMTDFTTVDQLHDILHEYLYGVGVSPARAVMEQLKEPDASDARQSFRDDTKRIKKDLAFREGYFLAFRLLAAGQIAKIQDVAKGWAALEPSHPDYAQLTLASFMDGVQSITPVASMAYLLVTKFGADENDNILLPFDMMNNAAHKLLMPIASAYIAASRVPPGASVN